MWWLVGLGCVRPISPPADTETSPPRDPLPTTTPRPAPPVPVLGWVGEATVVPGESWTGTEQQVALDADGERLCEYTWTSLAWGVETPDPTPLDCSDAAGNACDWQMTVLLIDGAVTGEPCLSFFGAPPGVEAGPFTYGWTTDWRDDAGSHGPWLLSRIDEVWVPVDPTATYDAETGALAYFLAADPL